MKVFPGSIKPINPIQKYRHISKSYACIPKIFVVMFLFCKAEDKERFINFFYLFRNMFYAKRIKTSNIIIMNIQSNPMTSNIRVLIKIHYLSPILYFSGIISRISTLKSRLILTIFLYFKIS